MAQSLLRCNVFVLNFLGLVFINFFLIKIFGWTSAEFLLNWLLTKNEFAPSLSGESTDSVLPYV